MNIFGPVPSRRLGLSLGINNIPYKNCSYSCLYCQCNKTKKRQTRRVEFYDPLEIAAQAGDRIQTTILKERFPDFITIVPDGEPALDLNLGKLIDALKIFGIPVAVISNGSMIADESVRDDLARADYVSLKVDARSERIWHRINKPASDLELDKIQTGMISFARNYRGRFVTETMLIKDINDGTEEMRSMAEFVGELKPDISFLAIPTRPTAYRNIKPAGSTKLTEAFSIFKEKVTHVELLNIEENGSFLSTGDLEKDILSISAVHPLREQTVFNLHKQTDDNINVLKRLMDHGLIKKTCYRGHVYYIRNFSKGAKHVR